MPSLGIYLYGMERTAGGGAGRGGVVWGLMVEGRMVVVCDLAMWLDCVLAVWADGGLWSVRWCVVSGGLGG